MRHYLDYTRSPWCSYLFVLPLLVLYQVMAVLANLGQRQMVVNGADALLRWALGSLGVPGLLASWVALAVIAGIVVYRIDPAHRKKSAPGAYFLILLAEATVYALGFVTVVAFFTALL